MNTSIFDYFKELSIQPPIDISTGDCSIYTDPVKLSIVLSFISNELKCFYDFETLIAPIKDESDKLSLYIETKGLLRDLDCPYASLFDISVETMFCNEESVNQLLEYLLSELAAAKINAKDYPNSDFLTKTQSIESGDVSLTTIMKPALKTLGIGRPPENMTVDFFFTKLLTEVKERLSKTPPNYLGKSLFSHKPLSEEQWNQVDQFINSLNNDYSLRRETLIQRLDVTIDSFMWCDKAKKDKNNMMKKYESMKSKIKPTIKITLFDLLDARENPFGQIYKTSSGESRKACVCKLNKHKMGSVPDRGGRTNEMEAPPPEMPAFQARDNSQPNRGRGGGNAPRPQSQHMPQSGGFNPSQKFDRQPQNQSMHMSTNFQKTITNDHYNSNYGGFSQNVAPQNFYHQSEHYQPEFQDIYQHQRPHSGNFDDYRNRQQNYSHHNPRGRGRGGNRNY